jgi:hypothetical protein
MRHSHHVPGLVIATALLTVGALGMPAAIAVGATVSVHVRIGEDGVVLGHLVFTGAPGEANRLSVYELTKPPGDFVFRDSANPVRARGDCRQLAWNAASCMPTDLLAAVRLGDGDDRATVAVPYEFAFAVYGGRGDDVLFAGGLRGVYGGPGDDVVVGGSGDDLLFGGSGADVLRGGPGADGLTGGPGRDRLEGGRGDDRLNDGETDAQAAPDVFDGGPNRPRGTANNGDLLAGDSLAYDRRHRGLRIDLARHRTSTEDRFTGIESLSGGAGDDRSERG